MFLNKKMHFISILSTVTLSACFASTTDLHPSVTSTATTSPIIVWSPNSINDRVAQKQKLLSDVSREIAEYNELVEQEKLLGNINTVQNNDTRQDTFFFIGESDKKVRAAYENLEKQISVLYSKYIILYKQDYVATPFPSLDANEKLELYYQLLQEDQNWVDKQLKTETAPKIYSPDLGTFESILDFEQTAWLDLRSQALNDLRIEAELSTDVVIRHKNIVEKLDGAPVEAREVTSLPFYRNDVTLFQYQTQKNYYILNADGAVIEIIPIQMPLSNQLTPNAPLNASQLEEKAREFITSLAPDTNLDTLTSINDSKIGSYFFRWEDRTKPVLDDGQSYPFIQVALNTDGELLNYYNTLPLSR